MVDLTLLSFYLVLVEYWSWLKERWEEEWGYTPLAMPELLAATNGVFVNYEPVELMQ